MTVVEATELMVAGVGLLLIKLSTRAEVTLGAIVDENVLASGGTIGMKGIDCAVLAVCETGTFVGTCVLMPEFDVTCDSSKG